MEKNFMEYNIPNINYSSCRDRARAVVFVSSVPVAKPLRHEFKNKGFACLLSRL
jgi:hypothetical protein